MKITRYKPQATVTFYTESGNLVARATNDPNSKIDDDVVTINTGRDMGADAPIFSITLTRRKHWHKWIGSNDLVTIQMQRPPEAHDVVFVGLVDDCRKKVAISEDGTPQRVITVTGRGVGKAFVQFDSGIVPESDVVEPSTGWVMAQGGKLAGNTCDAVLTSIWDTIGKKFVNYEWSNGKKLFDSIKCNFTSRPNLILADDSTLCNWQGDLWSLMKEIAEKPFYELYWEIDTDGAPVLYSRPTPFSEKEWNELTTVSIQDEDVVIDDTGRSDIETYSIFSVGSKTMFGPNDPYRTFATYPYWNKDYAKKYGIRRLHVSSLYIGSAKQSDVTKATDIMKALQTDLYNWNIKNNSMFNGTLVVKGSNKYKVGYKLRYTSVEDDTTLEYYIKSVSHNFVNFGSWVTELGIIRGYKAEDRFAEPYGKATEYSGLLGKFDPANALKAFMSREKSRSGGYSSGQYSGKAKAVVDGAISVMNEHRIVYSMTREQSYEAGVFDCSGFTQYVYKKYAGLDIGRTTGDQVTAGDRVEKGDLVPGDLVLFKDTYNSGMLYGSSHVGIYSGNGKFIHCSSGKGTVIESSLDEQYWVEHWLMGRRVIPLAFVPGNVNIDAMNRSLKGLLKGHAQDFVDAGAQYGVDPILAAAICIHEDSARPNNNNPGGLMDPSTNWKQLQHFDNITDGIYATVRNLKTRFYDNGQTTIESIGAEYAPVGAANDPNGLNKYWIPRVTQYYNELSGS